MRASVGPRTASYAPALRMARFHTANEFGDWDTVLHTFTFANAMHQALRAALAAHDTPDGVRLSAATWIVTARA